MFVQDHHSLEELQRLTKALRLETGTQLVIDSSCVPVFYSRLLRANERSLYLLGRGGSKDFVRSLEAFEMIHPARPARPGAGRHGALKYSYLLRANELCPRLASEVTLFARNPFSSSTLPHDFFVDHLILEDDNQLGVRLGGR